MHEAFGSFTDPAFTAAGGPLGHLSGRVAFAWAGAVLHVLSEEDVRAFAKHVYKILALGGVWFGVSLQIHPAILSGRPLCCHNRQWQQLVVMW